MYNIAIDGPAGAGKSTIAKIVAKELGFIYVDTGAMYRTIALACFRAGIKADESEKVRENMVEMQRELAAKNDVVMDGRDIGTAVLPNADLKIYLTASSRTRAERRCKELVEKGVNCDIDTVEKDIIDRDYRDMHREISPLTQAEDAVLVDSSNMSIDEVVKEIIKLKNER